jgi:cation diffusion facilitator CzcD-associated flavoprotein CzcO
MTIAEVERRTDEPIERAASRVALNASGVWISRLDAALASCDQTALEELLHADSHWRNLSGISWSIRTYSGRDRIASELIRRAKEAVAVNFILDPHVLQPRGNVVAGRAVIESVFRYESKNGPGEGVVRLTQSPDDPTWRAWTFSTALDIERICRDRSRDHVSQSHARDFAEPTWLEQRDVEVSYNDRDPEVLVVGGGHAGLSAAVELKRLGRDVLVVDREKRVGDNWRLRYDGLKLHNKTPINHLRYMPFPVTFPEFLPKDKVANWLEGYVDAMDINFWTEATFKSAAYDEGKQGWNVQIERAGSATRELHPKHIVLATSVSGTPNIPSIPTLESFQGTVLHSSEFSDAEQWRSCSVLVIGTGTSAHDVAQELHAHGAKVSMVQRNPTLIVNIDPSAQIYDQIYLSDGPPIEVRDLLNSSIPYPVARMAHKLITRKVKELDADLLDRLRKVGFKLDFGEDETGWPLKFRTRGGGYYFNIGCSDLIADGDIELIQATDIQRFTPSGLILNDGRTVKTDAVVLGTGFKGQDHVVNTLFGGAIAERVGTIWGLDPSYHELRNMWTRTGQRGLWFTGGAFSMCRIYSRFMALQIDAIEDGRLEK